MERRPARGTATTPSSRAGSASGSEDPRVVRSRELILDAARTTFAEHGYEQTSVDAVASRAGIAKRTIYNIYGDKETLFRAAIAASMAIAQGFTRDLTERIESLDDVEAGLPVVALELAATVFSGPVVPLRRLLARESTRFPDLASDYRERAPVAVIRSLSAGFATLARRGLLAVDDPDLAAEQFAYLVIGPEMDRRMLGAQPSDTAHIDAAIRSAVATFIRAHAPEP